MAIRAMIILPIPACAAMDIIQRSGVGIRARIAERAGVVPHQQQGVLDRVLGDGAVPG
ncbi:MAG: hypothetical protein H0W83_06795 [Planctomycetes bacterium]|nr:hypothetical protein [Planctomycetota bacterium]